MNIRQAIRTATTRLAPLNRIALGIPAPVWIAAGALLFAGLWLQEHDARVRRRAELQQMRDETATQVSKLRAKAAAAVREANEQNAAVIAELEAERRKLTGRAVDLSAQLDALKRQERGRAEEIATLSPALLQARLARQLGPESLAQISNPTVRQLTDAEQPQGQKADVALELSLPGARRVVAALAERDACREQNSIQERQVENCREQLATDAAEIRKQAESLGQLNQALAAKDAILERRESEFKAELRAARGTWRTRLARALKYVAIGAAIGAAIR